MSQYVSQPHIIIRKAIFRILRYLKGSPDFGVLFSAVETPQLKAFSDSDWAGCLDTRHSITGFVVYFGSSLISWKSKKQTIISQSSSEAKYKAMISVTCELQGFTYLLEDFGIQFSRPVLLYYDNRSALHIATNLVCHKAQKILRSIVTLL